MNRSFVFIALFWTVPSWALSFDELDSHFEAMSTQYRQLELVISVLDHRPSESTTETQIAVTWDISALRLSGTTTELIGVKPVGSADEFLSGNLKSEGGAKSIASLLAQPGSVPEMSPAPEAVKQTRFVLNDLHAWMARNRPFSETEQWNVEKFFRNKTSFISRSEKYGQLIESQLFLPELNLAFQRYHELGDSYTTVFMQGQEYMHRAVEPGPVENQWWDVWYFKHRVGVVKYKYLIEIGDSPRLLETRQSIRLPEEGNVPMLNIKTAWSNKFGQSEFPEKIVVQHLIDENLIGRTVTMDVLGAIVNPQLKENSFVLEPPQNSNMTDHTALDKFKLDSGGVR